MKKISIYYHIPKRFLILNELKKLVSLLVFVKYFFLHHLQLKKFLKNTKELGNSKSDKRCLIIGNGKSLNELNFDKVKSLQDSGELEIFVVNFLIVDTEIRDRIAPNYVFLSDPETKFDFKSERNKELWRFISEHPDVKVITPHTWHDSIPSCGSDCLHFNDISLEGLSKNISPLKVRGYASFTTYKAIAYTLFLNYSKILLIGLDNSWYKGVQVNTKNEIILDSFHFTNNYSEPKNITSHYTYGVAELFIDVSSSLTSLIELFPKKDIINLSNQSIIDCFPRNQGDYDEFIKG